MINLIEKPIFWDFITTDENGAMNGLKENTPDDIKSAYDEFIKKRNENQQNGIKC